MTAPMAPALRPAPRTRDQRLRSPLLLALWVLLAIEVVGGLVIFAARLAFGVTPGETLHIVAGLLLTGVYAVYQWGHWRRVRPFRARLDHALGLLAALFMAATNGTGVALGWAWWTRAGVGAVPYPPALSAAHNIGSMLVLSFVAAHFGAVWMRLRAARPPS